MEEKVIGFVQFPEWIKPEIFPGLPLRWYGLMYLVAFTITFLLVRYQAREQKLDVKDDEILNLFFWAIIGLIVGARVFATTIYDPTGTYLRKPWLIFWPFDEQFRFTGLQGMSYHGGVVGVVVAEIIYLRVKKWRFFEWADMMVAGIPLGYTFGRLGNFINGELFGRVTSVSWGMIFPYAQRFPSDQPWVQEAARKAGMETENLGKFVNLPRHPSQLYEAFFEGIFLWLILWFVFRKRKPFHGFIFSVYLIGYGVIRFIIEYFREPDIGIGFPIKFGPADNPTYLLLSPWNFTTGQILNFFMIVAGLVLIPVLRKLDARAAAEKEQKGTKKQSMRKLRKKIR